MIKKVLIVIITLCIFSVELQAQDNAYKSKKDIWNKIESLFTPPAEYKDKYGDYRDLLTFYNGGTVKTKEDWTLRREEIREKWHSMMGEWPSIIKDNKLEYLDSVKKEDFIRYTVSFYWTPTEKTTGYLSIPNKKGKKPAIITTFYEPETAAGISGNPNRDFAYQLTKRGYVTLSIGTSEATKAQTYSLFYPDIHNATIQPLSMLGYAAANAWEVLAKIPDVDSTRIGIVGHSFGGKWAMFASCLYEKFSCAAWSDPGIVFDEAIADVNYWEPYYLGYHAPPWRKRGMITEDNPSKGLYTQLREEGYDLHELHALMAPRPFLVSGGTSDPRKRWIPLNHSIRLYDFLGYENRVAMDNRPTHAPTPESNEFIYLFFDYFLK